MFFEKIMTVHLCLLAKQLTHLNQMLKYLEYSAQRVHHILPITNWQDFSFEQNETLAAFCVRFSEFQEHLDKTMRAIAIEEKVIAHILAPLKSYVPIKNTGFFALVGEEKYEYQIVRLK